MFTYIDVASINKEKGELGEELTILNPEDAPSRARKLVSEGTVIYSTVRPYLLNIAIVNKKFKYEPIVSTAFAVIHPCNGVSNKFILYYLRSISFIRYVESQMVGMAYPAINDEKLFGGVFPLPPTEEQERIVEKVDSLMAFCDKLEKALEKKVHYGWLSAKSVFNAVGNISDTEELEENLKFILLNFKDLSLGDNSVKELKNCILQLAVQGKLVPQNPNDEPAQVLLEKIREEKERLIKEKKIKKEKPLGEISEEEKPWILPSGWMWIRLGEVTQFISGYAFKSNTYIEKSDNQVIRLGNVKNEGLILDQKDIYIPDTIADECKNYMITNNDILVTMTGTRNKRDYFFTYKVCENDLTEQKLFLNQRVGLIRNYIVQQSEFLNISLKSNYILNRIFESETGTANQGNIGVKAINELVIPMPPLEEQKRIVKKVDSLIKLCNELEKKIEKQKDYSNRLMESILKSSF
ncbi:hypothetical protein SDC9_41175 [bioreactor metagenome]|uniref:Type I restriction modification DNA specificity domain-containing protein n=2 Tax=root TaxID=1 RepID=A0A644VX20_9ZZZZ